MNIFFGTIYELILGIMPGILFLKSHSYSPNNKNVLEKQKDEELISAYRQNLSQEIIAVLFDRYIHLVFGSCMKYLKKEDEAQDAAMEIFESIPEKLIKHQVEHFKSWLYITTKNACLMRLRKLKSMDNLDNFENMIQLSVENGSYMHLDNSDEDKKKLLKQCLGELKNEQKICVELMYLKDKSYKEIADETGYDLKHVKSYIQNGKRNLKAMLEKHHEREGRK